MDWLGQNWVWVLAGIAFLVLMSRGGLGHHGHGGGFGGGHGGHGGHGDGQTDGSRGSSAGGGGDSGAAIDPVSGNAVRKDRALTAAHGGHVFYFESAQTRERFEAEPDKYAANATSKDTLASPAPERRHRHGC
jgi:YHS domain-containing protein